MNKMFEISYAVIIGFYKRIRMLGKDYIIIQRNKVIRKWNDMDMYQKRKIRKENKKNNTQENSTKSSFNW